MNVQNIDQAYENAVLEAFNSGMSDEQILEAYLPQYEEAIAENNWALEGMAFTVLKRIADRSADPDSTWHRILAAHNLGKNRLPNRDVNTDLANAAEQLSSALKTVASGAPTEPAQESLNQFTSLIAERGFETESV